MPMPIEEYIERLTHAVELRRQGRYEEALSEADVLLIDYPTESSVWHTAAQLSTDVGRFGDALSYSREALRLANANGVTNLYQYRNIALGLAAALMRHGRFEEALPLWELGRLGASWEPWPGSAYWDGSTPVERLLVQAEGGYGDTFMFLRWLPLLKERRFVRRLGLTVWRPLETFCDWHALGVDDLYVIERDVVPFDWPYSVSIMSLPATFRMRTWADVPPIAPPSAPLPWPRGERTIARWRSSLLRLGFCWRAEENGSPVRTKSLSLDVAETIVYGMIHSGGYDIFRAISLSPEKTDLYSDSEFQQPRLCNYLPERMTNWCATAEYIRSMDFVLTVDTAVAHLCGLLGVPTLVLLPVSACWRWGLPGVPETNYRQHTWWYGPQMTVYRQTVPLQWDADAIVAATLERLKDWNLT